MVNRKYPVELIFMNDNHSRSKLCRLDQHPKFLPSNPFPLLAVYFGTFNELRETPPAAFTLLTLLHQAAQKDSERAYFACG